MGKVRVGERTGISGINLTLSSGNLVLERLFD
jgi:hypothetical protein